MTNKCYSRNGEDFRSVELGDLFDDMSADGELFVGASYWEATSRKPVHSEFLDVDSILEDMHQKAWDLADEYADDYAVNASGAAKDELRGIMLDWMERHLTIDFYTVHDAVEKKVTEDDVAVDNAGIEGVAQSHCPTSGT